MKEESVRDKALNMKAKWNNARVEIIKQTRRDVTNGITWEKVEEEGGEAWLLDAHVKWVDDHETTYRFKTIPDLQSDQLHT